MPKIFSLHLDKIQPRVAGVLRLRQEPVRAGGRLARLLRTAGRQGRQLATEAVEHEAIGTALDATIPSVVAISPLAALASVTTLRLARAAARDVSKGFRGLRLFRALRRARRKAGAVAFADVGAAAHWPQRVRHFPPNYFMQAAVPPHLPASTAAYYRDMGPALAAHPGPSSRYMTEPSLGAWSATPLAPSIRSMTYSPTLVRPAQTRGSFPSSQLYFRKRRPARLAFARVGGPAGATTGSSGVAYHSAGMTPHGFFKKG